jgi:hypothetical protein
VLKNKQTSLPFGTRWILKAVSVPNNNPAPPNNNTNRGTPSPGGEWIKTNISYYGQDANDDNGKGMIGVDLFRLGSSGNNCSRDNTSACVGPTKLKFNGKPVYPIAVHHDHAEKYLYKIMEVKGSKIKPGFLGVVADICNRVDSSCSNVRKNNLSFLVDIHKTGFAASGNTNNGQDFSTGETRVVGSISPKDIPKDAWIGQGAWFLCKCTGKCDSTQNQTWMDPKDPSKCNR